MRLVRRDGLIAQENNERQRPPVLFVSVTLVVMGNKRLSPRWMQFSVRTLLLVVVAVCVPLGWLASKRSERRAEQSAAIAIEKLGGHVGDNLDPFRDDSLPGPALLRFILGDDFFVRVRNVWLNNRMEVSDAALEPLDSLPHVEVLSLEATSISDAGLRRLQRMRGLKHLCLNETRVSDAGIGALKRLRRLETLEIENTLVTARGVAELQAALPKCKITRYVEAGEKHASSFLPLHDAAKAGDIEKIRTELAVGVPIDLRLWGVHSRGSKRDDWDGTTALMWAASRGQTTAVRFLSGMGANVNAKSSRGITPLMAAAGAVPTLDGDPLTCVAVLLSAGAKVDDKDSKGRMALFYACGDGEFFDEPTSGLLPPHLRLPNPFRLMRPNVVGNVGGNFFDSRRFQDLRHGDTRLVKALLAAGANPNAADQNGNSVITTAAARAEAARIQLLLAAGAAIRPQTLRDNPALRAAARQGDFATFKLLLDAGAETDAGLLACAAGSDVDAIDKVKLLLDRGVDPNEYGGEPHPPLLEALWGNSDAALTLLTGGANADFIDVNSDSALALAARHGPAEAVRLLLARGFNPNERSDYSYKGTVLIVAAESDREAANKVRHLIAAGADLECKDEQGRTALLAASGAGNMDAVVVLAEAGANVTVVGGEFGMTPLLCVANRGADVCYMCEQTGGRAARVLILHGADLQARDTDGRTARTLAEAIHHDEVVKVLDEFGG